MEIPEFRRRRLARSAAVPDPVLRLMGWWKVAGARMAGAVSLRGIRGGRILLAVPDASWEREVRRLSGEILSRLRRQEGWRDLEGIDLVLDTESASVDSKPWLPEHSLATAPEEIRLAAESIADPGIAQRWTRAVGWMLSRTKTRGFR